MSESTLISVYDASQLLGCSCQTVRQLIGRGVLQAEPLPGGRKLWLDRAQVEAMKEGMKKALRERRSQEKEKREALLQMWLDL